jgi:hypothetical protein
MEPQDPQNRSGDYQIYPNPASHQVTIKSARPDMDAIELYDITGKLFLLKEFRSPVQAATLKLDVTPGLYLIRINSAGQIQSSELVVE